MQMTLADKKTSFLLAVDENHDAWVQAFENLNVLFNDYLAKVKLQQILHQQATCHSSSSPSDGGSTSSPSAEKGNHVGIEKHRLETLEVSQWSEADVQEWLSFIFNDDYTCSLKSKVGEQFLEHHITGTQILHCDDSKLKECGIGEKLHRDLLVREITKLKKNSCTFKNNSCYCRYFLFQLFCLQQ